MDSFYPTKSVTIPAEIFSNSNPNVLLCMRAKQAKTRSKPQELKIQTVLVLMSQILIYNCVGERSELKIFK